MSGGVKNEGGVGCCICVTFVLHLDCGLWGFAPENVTSWVVV